MGKLDCVLAEVSRIQQMNRLVSHPEPSTLAGRGVGVSLVGRGGREAPTTLLGRRGVPATLPGRGVPATLPGRGVSQEGQGSSLQGRGVSLGGREISRPMSGALSGEAAEYLLDLALAALAHCLRPKRGRSLSNFLQCFLRPRLSCILESGRSFTYVPGNGLFSRSLFTRVMKLPPSSLKSIEY